MKNLNINIKCPVCSKSLQPQLFTCFECGVKVEGPFELNEFATLSDEDLNFLRVFIHCEGKIREMENILNLSYPTIRIRINNLRNKLNLHQINTFNEGIQKKALINKKELRMAILEELESGKISFEEAMKKLAENK